MECPYSSQQLKQLRNGLREIPEKHHNLREAYVFRLYQTDRGREFAFHGFARRLKTLTRCLENVLKILPPEFVGLPSRQQLDDLEIHLQAFVFNAFATLDNLAWIWVSERQSGREIPRAHVGLTSRNTTVRKSFSAEFRNLLASFDPWFDFLEDYRHALAHRIPLYVPSYAVSTATQGEYASLGMRMHDALRRRDLDEYDRLQEAQERLAVFQPCMMHSFGENARPIWFHFQLLDDFRTVEEIAWKMFDELNLPAGNSEAEPSPCSCAGP